MAVRALLLVLGCALALGGCGSGLEGSASDAERAQVRKYLRNVRDVACTHPPDVTRCEVRVRRSPVGLEAWHCEFSTASDSVLEAVSGTETCWTETGSPENLRIRPAR